MRWPRPRVKSGVTSAAPEAFKDAVAQFKDALAKAESALP